MLRSSIHTLLAVNLLLVMLISNNTSATTNTSSTLLCLISDQTEPGQTISGPPLPDVIGPAVIDNESVFDRAVLIIKGGWRHSFVITRQLKNQLSLSNSAKSLARLSGLEDQQLHCYHTHLYSREQVGNWLKQHSQNHRG